MNLKKKILLQTFRKIKTALQNRKSPAAFMILIILVLTLGTMQGARGSFSRSFTTGDSALAAKFDVIITVPEGFVTENDEQLFSYYFISLVDVKLLNFNIYNNGEADVICTPHVNNDIMYRVFISEIESPEFEVKAKEAVSFQLLIGPGGLDTKITEAELFVDIRQVEGGQTA